MKFTSISNRIVHQGLTYLGIDSSRSKVRLDETGAPWNPKTNVQRPDAASKLYRHMEWILCESLVIHACSAQRFRIFGTLRPFSELTRHIEHRESTQVSKPRLDVSPEKREVNQSGIIEGREKDAYSETGAHCPRRCLFAPCSVCSS